MANSFSPPRRNAMAPVQPVANVPMAVAPLYSAPTPQDAEVLKRFLLGAAKTTLAGVQFPGDLMHDAARSLRAGRPAGVYADLVETARRVSRDPAAVPGMVVNALKSQAEQARSSPGAMAETMGGMLDVRNMLRRKPTMAELDVYHGTPHTFEPEEGAPLGRFRSSKIGTGEGKQMYGYGIYLAEEQKTAKGYATTLANRDATNQGRLNAHANAQRLANLAGDPAFAADDIKYALEANPDHPQKTLLTDTLRFLETGDYKKPLSETGRVYKVDLPDTKIEQMLDWDKPISQQPAMQKAFNKFWKGLSKNERAQAVLDEFGDYDLAEQMAKNPGEVRGRLAYSLMTHHFGDQAAASDFLRQQGIPGIKYLDAGSRDGGKGTRNFVVFPGEEQHLTILERDGVKNIDKIPVETLEIPSGKSKRVTHTVPRYWYHSLRGRELGDQGQINPYEYFKETSLLRDELYRDPKPAGFVYLSPTPFSEDSYKIDVSKLDKNLMRLTGQSEGYAVYGGPIPASAIVSK